MDRPVPDRGDHEPDNARGVAELLDYLHARFRFVERQVEHGFDRGVMCTYALGDPPRVRTGDAYLHISDRVHAQRQHRRGKQDLKVDSHRFHRPFDDRRVAMLTGLTLLEITVGVPRQSASDVLVTDLGGSNGD